MQFKPHFNTNFFRKNIPSLPQYDWVLVGVVFVLCIFGLAFLGSSLTSNPKIGPDRYWSELLKQGFLGVGFGFLAVFFLARSDYHIWIKHRNNLMIGTLIMLFYVATFAIISAILGYDEAAKISFSNSFKFLPIRPAVVNNAFRWLDLPFGLPNIQPSEVAKITTLIFFAGGMGQFASQEFSFFNIKREVWVLILTLFMIFVQPDLGTVLLISGIVWTGFLVAGARWKVLIWMVILVSGFGYGSIKLVAYRNTRVSAVSAQVVNIQKAIANGGLMGKGYGNSEYKQIGEIYEANTDGIIGVISEEIGFVGTMVLLGMYLILVYRGLQIAHSAPDLEGRILASGITVWLAGQVFMNISGMTGLIPMKGIPLPFVSQGGTALVLNLLSVGILLSISHTKSLVPKSTLTKIQKSKTLS